MMGRRQTVGRVLRAAAMLIAVSALVLSRTVAAAAGLALPAVSGNMHLDCPGHSAAALDGHHHAHPNNGHHHPDAGRGEPLHSAATGDYPPDPEKLPHPERLHCCMTAAAVILPILDGMPLPSLEGARGVAPAPAFALQGHTPESPPEPPSTTDQG